MMPQFDAEALQQDNISNNVSMWLAGPEQLLTHPHHASLYNEAYATNPDVMIPHALSQSRPPIPGALPGVLDRIGMEPANNFINVEQMLDNAQLKNELPAVAIPGANSNIITLFNPQHNMSQDAGQDHVEQTPYLKRDGDFVAEHDFGQDQDDHNRIGLNFQEDDASAKKEKKSKKKKSKRQIVESEDNAEE